MGVLDDDHDDLTVGGVMDTSGGTSITKAVQFVARRGLVAVGLGVLITLCVAGVASAKGTPYFTVAISPPQPVAGEAVVVTVRTWEDVAHTVPASLASAATFEGLLVLRAADGVSPDVAVPLAYQAPDEFRATVVVPAAGDWKLVAFPDRTGWASPTVPAGYPDSIALTVLAGNSAVSINPPMASLGALIAIVGAAMILVVRARRVRSGSVIRSSEVD